MSNLLCGFNVAYNAMRFTNEIDRKLLYIISILFRFAQPNRKHFYYK